MTTIAATSRSMRRPLRASQTAKPRPSRPAIISAATTTSHESPAVTRSAVITCGAIAGSVTSRSSARAVDAEIARDPEVDARDVRHGRRRREHDGEERGHEDQEDRRRVADAEPEDRERDPGQRREAAEEVHERQERLARPRRVAEQQAGRHAQRDGQQEADHDAEQRRDGVVDEPAALELGDEAARDRPRVRKQRLGKRPSDDTSAHSATSTAGVTSARSGRLFRRRAGPGAAGESGAAVEGDVVEVVDGRSATASVSMSRLQTRWPRAISPHPQSWRRR